MQFVKPMPFAEAVEKLGRRSPIGSSLSSSEWRDVPVALRERAMFSSRVESIRFLQRGRDGIADWLQSNRETLPNGEIALKTGSRQEFVKQMQQFAIAEGMGPLDPKHAGTIKDITSQRRLELIFDTQTRQAQDYGYWKQGQDPDVLNEFPAQRFIRVMDVNEPREWHVQFEDQVRLKSDVAFWTAINRDFSVPWGPWGWGCGHDVEDVDRAEAERLGLIRHGDKPVPAEPQFNDRLEASARGLDPDLLDMLKNAFGDQIAVNGDTVQWSATRPARPWEPPKPAPAPSTVGTPTLESVMKAAGIEGKTELTEQEARRFIDELKEEQPVQRSEVMHDVKGAGKTPAMATHKVESAAQEFLDFIPPHKAKSLPKLHFTIKTESGENGHYSPSSKQVVVGAHLATDEERRRVVCHEMMHWLHLEGPKEYRKAIADHFQARTKGEKTSTLPGYRSGTKGRTDKWFEPYAGRIYGAGFDSSAGEGVELPTRYIETLTKPSEFARLWKNAEFRETMTVVLRALF